MKILFLGEYEETEIVAAPIKVGKELFKSFKGSRHHICYLPYFQDGNIYSRIQKLFGFEKITYKVYRTGIFPLLAFVIKFRPQVIHVITPALYYMVLLPLRIFFRYKIVSTLHSINRYVIPHLSNIKGYQKFRFLLIDYLLVKYSDYLFVYSKRDKRYISMYYKVKPDKIIVVNNGFNEVDIRKEDFSNNFPLKVAFIGNINRKEKAFDLLFNTLSMLNQQVILSVFSHDKQVEKRNYNSINVELKIHGPLSELELRQELANYDIFILPSQYESFSIALLEAMSTGIIIIASSRVGLTERFTPKLKNLVFKKGNTNDLIDRIHFYLKMDNVQKLSLSSEIINFTKNYSWNKVAFDYQVLYTHILMQE